MKKSLVVFVCAALASGAPALFSAPVSVPTLSLSDQAWMALQVPVARRSPAFDSTVRNVDPAEVKTMLASRAAAYLARANQAKEFHTKFPQDPKAANAKLMEVRALVGVVEAGNATVEGRLADAVQALRVDHLASDAVKVQGVAAYEFSRQTRGLRTQAERLKCIEQVARVLARDFPEQPQGFESLLNVAIADRNEANAKAIVSDLLLMPTPPALKTEARKYLDRLALVGKPLEAELRGANELAPRASSVPGLPTIIYTWARGNPGSLALAADLKKRGLTANVIALNVDTDQKLAAKTAGAEGLIGTLVYDSRGVEGALAQRLKVRGAAEVFLVDAQGVIREVRAQSDLANALRRIGL